MEVLNNIKHKGLKAGFVFALTAVVTLHGCGDKDQTAENCEPIDPDIPTKNIPDNVYNQNYYWPENLCKPELEKLRKESEESIGIYVES